jgi:CheY-like chemotaxis protein
MSFRILVIDDSVTVRQAVMKFLTAEGYDVVTTADAAKVLDIIKQIEPDLVISDIMMPEMDGYTFLRHVRKEKSLRSLPVILMSSKKREAMQDLFAYEGVSGYLEKPFTQEELTELIKKTLRQREKE